MPQVASMGAAVAVADFDRDGWQDFYVTNSGEGSLNRLYRNAGNGTFSDVAAELGVANVNQAGTGVSMGAVWGDYDNDGYEDLFLYKYGRPELFHNDNGRGFTPVGERSGLPRWVNANSAVWLDYDRDGWLDLFLAGYWPEDVNLWNLTTTRIMPESFEYAENGGRKYLLRNRGNGTFEETAAAVGIGSRRWTLAVSAADLLGTGYPDLFFANDYGVSELYANRGGKQFVDVGRETGVGRTPKSGMNAAFGDIFNDGRLSIYKTNISEPGVLVQANDLWVPKQAGARRGTRVREPGLEPGRGSGRLELGGAVRRPEQRWNARHLSGERLRLGRGPNELLVRLLRDRGRPQRHHRRRAELAADAGPKPVRISAKAGLDQRRRWAASPRWRRSSARPTSTMAAPSRWRICRTPACST